MKPRKEEPYQKINTVGEFLETPESPTEGAKQAMPELELSLCKHLFGDQMSAEEKHAIFDQNLIAFEKFDVDPYKVLLNENLCFRIESEIVESRIAIPQIISLLAFNKEISQKGLVKVLETKFMPLNQATRAISKIPPSNDHGNCRHARGEATQ